MRRRALAISAALALGGCEQILGIEDPVLSESDVTLGIPCGDNFQDNGFNGGCPGGSCVQFIEDQGDPGNNGYCTPFCQNATDCANGYTGPGRPECALFEADQPPTRCVIVCADSSECPPPLECFTVTNSDTMEVNTVCGGPGWGPR